ncbi:hypothetical protein LJ655_25695, partial [Paraburkholderia sp. MMS20-SJTN17]
ELTPHRRVRSARFAVESLLDFAWNARSPCRGTAARFARNTQRDLIRAGIHEESIGLLHQYKYDSVRSAEEVGPGTGYASEPATSPDREYPILLLSHARIQNGCTATFQGRPRSLLIWDESLISTTAKAMSVQEIRRVRNHAETDKPELLPHLDKIVSVIDAELAALKADPSRKPRLLAELLPLGEFVEAGETANSLSQHDKAASWLRDEVLNLLALISLPVSVLMTGNGDTGDGIVRYAITVPDELSNVAVLDASYVIRDLTQADASIVDRTTPEMLGYKSYSNVTVNQVKLATGKQAMSDSVEASKPAAHELQKVIDAVPPDECVLVFTFKDARQKLIRNLRQLGVNLDAMVEIDGKPRRRIEVLTWGQETSRNDLLHCRHVVMAGVLRRNPLELAAALSGQQRLGESPRLHTAGALRRLNVSEMAHSVLQGMNRGACRVMDGDGQAQRMKLTILVAGAGAGELREALQPVLPGVVWRVREPATKSPSRTQQARRAIATFLTETNENRVPVRALRGAVGIELGTDAMRTAVDSALQDLRDAGHCWRRDARSLVRERGQAHVGHDMGQSR